MLAGAAFLALAVFSVWRRRVATTIASLLVVLLAAMFWSITYALELTADDLAGREFWGDLKYVGICLLAPAWLAFVLRCTGRTSWPGWVGLLLALEPLAVLFLLANEATHDLIRFQPPQVAAGAQPVAEAGPLFWPHLIYTDALIWVGTAILVVTLGRMSGLYRRQSAILVAAILLPIVLNLLFNLKAGPFGRVDLTPFGFVLTTAVLVWGVFQFSLLDLRPVARGRIFQTISDPVLVLDPVGRVIDANPAAGELVGQPVTTVVGQPVERLLPTWTTTLTGALRSGADQNSDEVMLHGRIYDLAISTLPDRRRQPGGHLLVARDVTERRQIEERLCAALNHELVATDRLAVALDRERAAAEHLRTLDELKSGFLQAVSHDLRTPLASVLGIALTLQRGRVRLRPTDVDDLLGRLISNARKLDRLLTSLLDLDRLDRGIVELQRERVDLARLVAGVVKEARDDLLDAHPVNVELAPVQVTVDSAKIERIVENLLANAARHTAPGTPIWVKLEQRDRGALLCVDDAGPGVPAEQREAIFQPFQRGPSLTAYGAGSGVGLALVAQFAGLHDGRVWVEDRAGGGASFRVMLPGAHKG
jgi:PAS domain S-box-containing protein